MIPDEKKEPDDELIRLCVCGHNIYWHDDYDFETHECNFHGCTCKQFKDIDEE